MKEQFINPIIEINLLEDRDIIETSGVLGGDSWAGDDSVEFPN